jgi:hypothetical protein
MVLLPAGSRDLSLRHSVQTSSETHPYSIQWVQRALSTGAKRPVRESDHLPPPSSAEIKNGGAYVRSPVRLHGVVLN